MKKGEYVKGEILKREKIDVQTKPSFQKKKRKRYMKRDQQRTTFKNENKKEKCFSNKKNTRIKQKKEK